MTNESARVRSGGEDPNSWLGKQVVPKGIGNAMSIVPLSLVFNVTGDNGSTIQINGYPDWISKDGFELYNQ